MFNLEYLQYITFGILAIPPFVVGFKKGWKAALLLAVVLFALSGLIVGISYLVYDDMLWPMFRNLFIKKHVGSGLDANQISDISKPSIIVTVLGIMILPFFFISWIIFIIFKKLLLRHMQPRVKRINNNQAKIWRKNNTTSKIIGGTILGASGIVIAATAAGAVSTFTVNTKRNNVFTNAITALGRGYSFNKGYYDSDYQHMYEYLPMTHKAAEMSSLKRVFALDANNPVSATDVNTIVNSKEWHTKTKELLSKKRSAIALVKLAISNNNQYDLTNVNSNKAINDLRMVIDNSKLKFNMPSDAIDEVTEYVLKNRILQFEKTSVYLDWKNAIKVVERLTKDLNVLKTHKQKLADLRTKLASDLRTLENDRDNVQPKIVSETAALKQTYKDSMDAAYTKWQGLIQPMSKAEVDKNDAETKYNDAVNDYNSKLADYEAAVQAKNENDSEIRDLERNIADTTNKIRDNENKIHIADGIKNRLISEISSLNNEVNSKINDISAKNKDKNTQEANRISAQAEYTRLMAIYNDNTKPQQERDQAHSDASIEQGKINDAANKINSLNSDIAALEAEMDAAKRSITSKEAQKSEQKRIINKANGELTDDRARKVKDENSLSTRKNDIGRLEQERDSKKRKSDNANQEKIKKQSEFNSKNAVYQEAKRKHDEASDKYWKAKTTYDNNQQRWQAAKDKIERLNTKLIPDKKKEITTNNNAITNNQKEIDDKTKDLNDAKSDEKVREDLKIKENKKFDSKKEEIRQIYKSALK